MIKVGFVTDPLWLEPFTIEDDKYIINKKMCPHCGEDYETSRIYKTGPAKGMGVCAPLHLDTCQHLHSLEREIYKQFGIPEELLK